MKITFWTEQNMGAFWDYVKVLLEAAAPGVMIWFALIGVGLILGIIVKAWNESSKEEKEDEYEYREY